MVFSAKVISKQFPTVGSLAYPLESVKHKMAWFEKKKIPA